MNNFKKIAASPEVLGAFLDSLNVATGPWDERFHKAFCDSCEREMCDAGRCPHEKERNNPLWWLTQEASGERTAVRRAVCRNGRTELEPGMMIALENPLRVHIRVARNESPTGEILTGESAGTRLETAWQAVEEVKKVHPNAEISVEVEV